MTYIEWLMMAQVLFTDVVRCIRYLTEALDKETAIGITATSQDTPTCKLNEIFAAWIQAEVKLTPEGKTKTRDDNELSFAEKRFSTAWCWDDWLCLQGLAEQFINGPDAHQVAIQRPC